MHAAAPMAADAASVSLDECVRAALTRAAQIRGAAAEARAADARLRAAAAAYMPRLVGKMEYGVAGGFDKAVTNGGTTATLLGFELPLLDGGLRAAAWSAARARSVSTQAALQQRRASVVLSVRTAYLTAIGARHEAQIQADAVAALNAYVRLLRQQELRGLVPRTDVLRAELAVATARSARRSADAAAASAVRDVGALTAIDVALIDLVEPPPRPVAETPSQGMIDASPMLAEAEAQAEAARHDAAVARSELGIHLSLTADGGFLGVQPDQTFRQNGGGQFLLGFNLPLYDGGAAAARAAAALATAASAEANVEHLRQTIVMALGRLQVEAERAGADVAVWRDAVPQAADAFQLMRARYVGGGSVKLLEVLDALNQAVATRVALVRGRVTSELVSAMQDELLGVTP